MTYFNPVLHTLNQFAINFAAHIPNLLIALIVLLITFFLSKLIVHLVGMSLTRLALQTNLVLVLQQITSIIIWLISVLIVAVIIFPSVTAGNLLAALGLTSVAIGFAFKDIFENFLAGILILLREPFHIGDYIIIKSHEGGYVEKISVRNTHLHQSDGMRLVIPNAMLFNNLIQVVTDLEIRRTNIICAVGFTEDVDKVRNIINNVLKKCESISKEKNTYTYIKSFSSNGIEFDIYWWTKSKPRDIRLSHDEVFSGIKKAFDTENIKLTYSTTINFQEPLEIRQDKEKDIKK